MTGLNRWASLLVLAVLLGMANYLAARHYRRGDWTRARMFSISDKTAQVLKALDKDVRVTAFLVPAGRGQESIYDEVKELLARFQRYSGHVRVELLDFDRDRSRADLLVKKYKINTDDAAQGGVVVFESGDRNKYVTRDEMAEYDVQPDTGVRSLKAFKGEGAFLSAIRTVTETSQPVICFSTGHGEAEIDSYEDSGYGYLDEELKRDNYKTRKLDGRALRDKPPAGCDVIAVAGPQRAFAPGEAAVLDAALAAGGKLLLLLGPAFERGLGGFLRLGLEDVAERWGARLGQNVVLDDFAVLGEQPLLTWGTVEGYGDHPIVRGMRGKPTVWVLAREVRPMPHEGLDARELVRSGDKGWGETNLAVLRGEAEPQMDAATDVKGPVPVAVAAEDTKKGSRMVVLGSSQLVSNARLSGLVRDYDKDLVLSAIAWLTHKETLVAVGPKNPENFKLALGADQAMNIFYVSFIGLPGLGLIAGAMIWWRRRR
jgi:gliding motility-associatede transport system auxiliary component